MIEEELLRWRMHSQFGTDTNQISVIARRSAGIQAQDAAATRLALRARGLADPDGLQAAYAAGEVVSDWLMRTTLHPRPVSRFPPGPARPARTLTARPKRPSSSATRAPRPHAESTHRTTRPDPTRIVRQALVPAGDLAWLLPLFAARNLAATARRRRELGLTEELCAAALAALPGLLAPPRPTSASSHRTPPLEGRGLPDAAPAVPRGRAELVAALRDAGVPVPAEGQAPAHLMLYAAAHGVLCRGADVPDGRRGEPGYVPVPAGRLLSEEAAPAELAGRYLGAYGPAGPEDFAAWSGLTRVAARRAFAAAGAVEAAPGLFTAPGARPPADGAPLVRLLGPYDTYLLGYRGREAMLDPVYARRINAGGGVIRPALVVDGRVRGTWRRERAELVVEPFGRLDVGQRPGVAAEAEALGRFLGEPLTLRIE